MKTLTSRGSYKDTVGLTHYVIVQPSLHQARALYTFSGCGKHNQIVPGARIKREVVTCCHCIVAPFGTFKALEQQVNCTLEQLYEAVNA